MITDRSTKQAEVEGQAAPTRHSATVTCQYQYQYQHRFLARGMLLPSGGKSH